MPEFYSDTFFSPVKSLNGNTCVQLFTNRGSFVKSYPMTAKSEASTMLKRFLHEVGIPSSILTDNAKELVNAEWKKLCGNHNIRMKASKPYTPWQNAAELYGGMIKVKVRTLMRLTNTPLHLWDYCWMYCCELKSLTVTKLTYLDGRTPFEKVFGYTPDISEFMDLSWFEWVWYHDPSDDVKIKLGRWIGPAHSVGQGMESYILTDKSTVVTRSSISKLSIDEVQSEDVKVKMKNFTENIELGIGNYSKPVFNDTSIPSDVEDIYDLIFPDLEEDELVPEPGAVDNEFLNQNNPDLPDVELNDHNIGLKVQLPHRGEYIEGTIKNRKRNHDGTLVGKESINPILDTRIYNVEFPDGVVEEFPTNVLLENLYEQVDDDGLSSSHLNGISDYKFDETALKKSEGWTQGKSNKCRVITAKGWFFKVDWKDGTSNWVHLSQLKESNPLDLADFVISRGIQNEPAFAWWVPQIV